MVHCVRLHSTYLTRSSLAFSITLTTMAFDHSSLWWFGISTCIAIPRGPPSSSMQHSYTMRHSVTRIRFRGAQSSAYLMKLTFLVFFPLLGYLAISNFSILSNVILAKIGDMSNNRVGLLSTPSSRNRT
ncbi:predicted protein [Methanosarcina acetivorans C2A]|uniref:Uncharacterized protein n=1 Tax=Methanosarcina acetivorans (strain ATCC 35395 / DSM 2834 / JCM 12185 / C2A) TaxID=188937 RepID=Q8TM72_METAC|nr:predicted protein [Methanosarcina acetivorans C2A]